MCVLKNHSHLKILFPLSTKNAVAHVGILQQKLKDVSGTDDANEPLVEWPLKVEDIMKHFPASGATPTVSVKLSKTTSEVDHIGWSRLELNFYGPDHEKQPGFVGFFLGQDFKSLPKAAAKVTFVLSCTAGKGEFDKIIRGPFSYTFKEGLSGTSWGVLGFLKRDVLEKAVDVTFAVEIKHITRILE